MKKLNITIIGLGHIGGSIAASLKQVHKSKVTLIGIDKDLATLKKAKKSNFFSEVSSLKQSKKLKESDIIFIAVGIKSIPLLFSEISNLEFQKKIIVTDVGSVKSEVFKFAKQILPKNINFVGGHPIAGTEKIGFSNLVSGLFHKKPVFISGTRATKDSISLVVRIWESLGSSVFFISPEQHDKIFAYLSHLPHVLAFGLKNMVNKTLSKRELIKYGGTSYKDYSRISESSEDLWAEIFLSNRKNLISRIKDFKKYLDKLEKLLSTNSKEKVKKHLKS